jgi:hypothetical protein
MPGQYGASDILATLGLASAFGKFEVQSFTVRSGKNQAQRRSRLNDVLEDIDTETILEYDISIKIKEFNVSSVKVNLGGEGYASGEFVVTKLGVKQVLNDHPEVSITVHTHPVKNPGSKHHARKYEFTLPALDWGVNSALSVSGAGLLDVTSVNTECSVDHTDELNREGTKWLIGTSHNGRIEETIEIAKGHGTLTVAAGWKEEPHSEKQGNTEFATITRKFHKFVDLT